MLTVSDNKCIPNPNELVQRVQAALSKLSYHQLDSVRCDIGADDHITLTGSLHSYYLKQIAQTIALKVPGVNQVTNQILVKD